MKKIIKLILVLSRYSFIITGTWLIILNTIVQGGQRNQLYPFINTRFSQDFSDSKWQKIAYGQSKDEVIKLLGQPLNSWEVKSKNCIYPANSDSAMDFSQGIGRKFMYSRYASCTYTVIVDSSMKVVSKHIFWDED